MYVSLKLKLYFLIFQEYSTCLAIHETARTKDALLHLQDYIEQQKSKDPNLTPTDQLLLQMFEGR